MLEGVRPGTGRVEWFCKAHVATGATEGKSTCPQPVVTPEANLVLIFTYSTSCRVDVATCGVQYSSNLNGCNRWHSVLPSCCQTQWIQIWLGVTVRMGSGALIIHAMPKLNDQNWNIKYEQCVKSTLRAHLPKPW